MPAQYARAGVFYVYGLRAMMPSGEVRCAGCRGLIEDNAFMRCTKCKNFFDILCANFTKEEYVALSLEFKKRWICVECRSKMPKGDNSTTPVRQAHVHDISIAASDCPDESICSVDNVTTRTTGPQRYPRAPNLNDTLDSVFDTVRISIVQELKDMHIEFETRLMTKVGQVLDSNFKVLKTEMFSKMDQISQKMVALENRLNSVTGLSIISGNGEHQKTGTSTLPAPPHTSAKPKTRVKPNEAPQYVLAGAYEAPTQQRPTHLEKRDTLVPENDVGAGKENEWTEVKRKRQRLSATSVLRGTAAPGTTCLEAAERWKYLHLYYVKKGTTDAQVADHLKVVCDEDTCTVEALKSRGNYSSFKVGAPSRLVETVLDSRNWAADICIKPWRQNFRRSRDADGAKEAPK